jgi:hypothetical protein
MALTVPLDLPRTAARGAVGAATPGLITTERDSAMTTHDTSTAVPADNDLLLRWYVYQAAAATLNLTTGGGDDSPEGIAYDAATKAMDAAPIPTTVPGVIALLRFALSNAATDIPTNNLVMYEPDDVLRDGLRGKLDDLTEDTRVIASALVGLLAMEARS